MPSAFLEATGEKQINSAAHGEKENLDLGEEALVTAGIKETSNGVVGTVPGIG